MEFLIRASQLGPADETSDGQSRRKQHAAS